MGTFPLVPAAQPEGWGEGCPGSGPLFVSLSGRGWSQGSCFAAAAQDPPTPTVTTEDYL